MFPVTITLNNISDLQKVQSVLYPTTAVVEVKETKKSAPATTAAAASSQTPAAAQAPAHTTAPADAGNVAASTGSSPKPEESAAPGVTFDVLKKAFLALSTKPEGRSKCEGVLKPHGLGRLSEAKEEQYAALLDAINKAAA